MKSAPIPENESNRLNKLNLYQVLDTPPEEAFDRITRLIAEIIDVPIALVSLVDSERQWFKSKYGLDAAETSREIAFCAHAILDDVPFIVEDTSKDTRFSDNPLVVNDPSIRFYAGAPLTTPDGLNIGTLCAIDRVPRKLTTQQTQLLTDFASIVVDELELRVALRGAMNDVADEVRRAELKNEFVSMVTHELRTPLTSIKGALALLNGGVLEALPEKSADLVNLAHRNADRLLVLINDLLDFQKMEAGIIDIEFAVVESKTLIREAYESMQGYAEGAEIALRIDTEVEVNIVADGSRLSQVLTNLISNAIKFSPKGDEVVIGAKKDNRAITFSVTDNGSGIPPEIRDHIFEKFTQASGENKRKGTGLGFGGRADMVHAKILLLVSYNILSPRFLPFTCSSVKVASSPRTRFNPTFKYV